MEVHLQPDTEQQLRDLSVQSGRGTDELVEDAVLVYVAEMRELRETLAKRCNQPETGGVQAIPAEEVEAHFREKSAAAKAVRPS